jgi:hypothetical protein
MGYLNFGKEDIALIIKAGFNDPCFTADPEVPGSIPDVVRFSE